MNKILEDRSTISISNPWHGLVGQDEIEGLADFLDNVPVSWHLVGSDGIILYANRVELELLGYESEEYIGCHVSNFHIDEHVINDILTRLTNGQTLDNIEARLRCKDGSIKHVLINSNVHWKSGKFVHTRCFTRDITEHKLAEKEKFFGASLDLMCTARRDGRLSHVNPAFVNTFGHTYNELTSHQFIEFVHPDDREATQTKFDSVLRGMDIVHFENRWLCKDGSYRWLAWNCPAHCSDTELIYAIARDVTELKDAIADRERVEDSLRQQQDQLSHFARVSVMGELVTGIAHEVNQPLTSISGLATVCELLLDQDDIPDRKKLKNTVQKITAQVLRCGMVINRLRRFVKKSEPLRNSIDVNDVIRESVGLVASEAAMWNSTIRLTLLDEAGKVNADEVQLQQVVVNLLLNALEAMESIPADERWVEIHTTVVENAVRITVIDNGTGMSDDERNSVFDAFYTSKSSGIGMGLAVCRSIVEAHEGKIWAVANPGRGAVLVCELPTEKGA